MFIYSQSSNTFENALAYRKGNKNAQNSLNNFFILNNQTQKSNQEKWKFSHKLIRITYSRYNV